MPLEKLTVSYFLNIQLFIVTNRGKCVKNAEKISVNKVTDRTHAKACLDGISRNKTGRFIGG